MKFSLERFKSIDWKKFFVSHGEKVALGVVGLIVVFVLYKTKYATFTEKKPAEFVKAVSDNDLALTQAKWPVSEQLVYDKNYDVEALYKNNYREVKPDKFLYDGFPIVWAVHRRQEDIQEPTWFPVEDLEIYAGRMILELPTAGDNGMNPEDPLLAANNPTNPNDGQMSDAERRIREQRQAKKPQQGGEFGPGVGRGGPMGLNEGNPMLPSDQHLAGPMGMGDMGEGTGETGVVLNIRGMRYVAVRGVLPFAKQYKAVQKAQHDTHRKPVEEVVGIKDFEIQRKTAQPGSDPWGDPDKGWKTLDISLSRDVIQSAANFDEEIADWTQTSNVITSPLPSRLLWVWNSDWVGHKKIKSLSDKEQELRRMLNEQLVAMQKDQEATDALGRGGFATMTQDVRNLQEGVANDAGQRIKFRKNLAQQFNIGGEEGGQLPPGIDGILDQTNEIPEYMLFRYFDFDVEPGQAYRYRVRVVLNNPNYDKLPETLAAPDVGEGKTRYTPWSGISPVAILPDDSKFYVSDVIPGTRSREPKAKINLYQWLKQVGTTANQIVEVQIGQIIGQPAAVENTNPKAKEKWVDESLLVEVLRPYQSFKKEAMELLTKSAVVDLVDSPGKQGRDFHPDLKLSALQPTWQGEVRPLSQVLVVNEFGELENRNPIAQRQEQYLTKLALTIEQEDFLDLKKLGTFEAGDDPMSEGGSVDDLYGAGGGEDPMNDGAQNGRGRKRPSRPGTNPTRRGQGRSGA